MSSRLVLKSLWNNGLCTYAVTFKKMTAEDRREVERLADEVGFTREDDIWTPPTGGRGVSEFFRLVRNAGFGLEFDDPTDALFNLQRLHLDTSTRWSLDRIPEFELYHLSGWTPVQAEGSVNGHHFYFRARGSYWRFEVGGNEKFTRSPRWWHEENWPSITGFEAGYMSDENAVKCILKAIGLLRNGDNARFRPEHPEYERTVLEGWSAGALSLRIVTIRLGICGQDVLNRMEKLDIELPYTADLELKHVQRLPIKRLRPRAGR